MEGCWGQCCEVKRCVKVQGVSFFRRPWDRCRSGQEWREGGLLRCGGGPQGAGLEECGGGSNRAMGGQEELQQRRGVCSGVQRGEEGEFEVGGFLFFDEGRGGGGPRAFVRRGGGRVHRRRMLREGGGGWGEEKGGGRLRIEGEKRRGG